MARYAVITWEHRGQPGAEVRRRGAHPRDRGLYAAHGKHSGRRARAWWILHMGWLPFG